MGARLSLWEILGKMKSRFSRPADATEAAEAKAPLLPRPTRVRIVPLHGVHFERSDLGASHPILVANVSTTGLGLLNEEGFSWPPEGAMIEGVLVRGELRVPVTAKIIHRGEMVVGCAIKQGRSELRGFVESYFITEIQAQTMNQVKTQFLKPDPEGQPHWFVGNKGCELYYVESSGRVVHFHMSLLGHYVEGRAGSEPRFGTVLSDDFSDGLKYKGSEMVQSDNEVSEERRHLAILFVENMRLPASIQSQLVELLKMPGASA